MNRLLLLLLAFALAGSIPSTGQTLVTVSVDKSKIYVGLNTMTSIWVEVKKGYHVQANKVNDESLVPTTLEVNDVKGIIISKKEFPPGEQFKLEGTDTFLSVYDGKFLIKLFLTSSAELKAGTYVLDAKLRYQACDSKSCFFPKIIDFSIPVEVQTKK
jgi:hypothetical protein